MTFRSALLFFAFGSPALAGETEPLNQTPPTSQGKSVLANLKFASASEGTRVRGYPLALASSVYQADADFEDRPGEMSAFDFALWSPLFHHRIGDVHIVPGFGFRSTRFDTSIDQLLTERTLSSIRLPLVVLHDLSEDWIYGGMIMPGFSGDLSNGDNFSLSAAFGVGRQVNSELIVGAGAFYSRGFNDDLFVPGIVFSWRPSLRWEISFLGPFASVTYALNDDWFASVIGQYDAITWNIEADDQGPERDISSNSFRVGLRLEKRISDLFWINLTGGLSTAREITIEDLDNHTLQEDDLDAAPFIQVGGNVRF